MKVYSNTSGDLSVELAPLGALNVFNASDVKDALKARGYRFDPVREAWEKPVTSEALAAELRFLDGEGAVAEAYGYLDYVLIGQTIPGLPARERKLTKTELETTYMTVDPYLRLLGDPDVDPKTKRQLYERLRRGTFKEHFRGTFDETVESARKSLLYTGGLLGEE